MRLKIVFAFLLMGVSAAGLIAYGMRQNMVYYYLVDEFLKNPHPGRVRVSGQVAVGSIQKEGPNKIAFTIQHKGRSLRVVYQGVIPDAFVERAQAVVEGEYRGHRFHADKLMAKCPSKFEGKVGNRTARRTSQDLTP